MTIPPAGRERNLLIAEMKGITPVFACYVDNIGGDNYCVLDDEKPWDCTICEREGITNKEVCKQWKQRFESEWLPEYSTSRNDAWELWDELPISKHYGINDLGEHLVTWYQDTTQKTISGTSFAEAVSKAWIEYKESIEEVKT